MPSSFVTPDRQPTDRNGGGSSRRVVRSALEMLLESQSPDLRSAGASPAAATAPTTATAPPRRGDSEERRRAPATDAARTAAVPPPPKGFTVTYATHSAGSGTRPAPTTRQHNQQPALSQAGGSKSRSQSDERQRQEPSTLLFLSPNSGPARPKPAPAEEPAEKPSKATRTRPTERRTTPPQAPAPIAPSPGASRSLLEEVEQATESGDTRRGPSAAAADVPSTSSSTSSTLPPPPKSSRGGASHSSGRGHRYTEAELERRIADAVAAYEKQRDDEETAVLQQIDKEIAEKERVNRTLLTEKEEIRRVAKSLREELSKVVQQCQEVEAEKQQLLQSQQQLQEAVRAAEVELCHAHDAQREQQRLQGKTENEALEKARADAEELRERCTAAEARARALEAQVAEREAELAEVRQQYSDEYLDIKTKMLTLGECMSSTETTLRDKDTAIAQLQRRVAEAERGKSAAAAAVKGEVDGLTARVAELQELLQAQTDEVRRRMARVLALEKEKKTLQKQLAAAAESTAAAGEHQAALERALEELLAHVRKDQRRLVAASLVKPDSPSAAGEKGSQLKRKAAAAARSPPSAQDQTNPFSSDDEGEDEEGGYDSAPSIAMSDADEDDESGEAPARGENRASRGGALGRRAASGGLLTALRARSASSLSSGVSRAQGRRGRRTGSAPAAAVAAAAAPSAPPQSDALAASAKALSRRYATSARVVDDLSAAIHAFSRRTQRYTATLAEKAETQSCAARTAEELAGRLETACRYLKTKLTEREQELAELGEECDARGRDLDVLKQDADAGRERGDALAQQVRELETATAELADAKEAVEKEVVRMHSQLQEAAATVETLEAAKASLQARADAAEADAAQLPAVQRALEEKTSGAVDLVEKLRAAEVRLTATDAEAATLREQLAALHTQVGAARGERAADRARTEQAEAERQRLQDALVLAQKDATEARSELAKARTAHEAAGKEQEERAATLNESARTYRTQITELVREMEMRRAGELATLQTILDTLKAAKATADEEAGGDGDGDGDDAEVEDVEGLLSSPDLSSLLQVHSTARRSLHSTPDKGRVRVRVAMLGDSLSTEKKKARGAKTAVAGKTSTASASTATGRKKGTALLRREVVRAVRAAAEELLRLRRQGSQTSPPELQQLADNSSPADSFQHAELMAREAARHLQQQQQQRGHSSGGSCGACAGVADDCHSWEHAAAGRSPFPSAQLFATPQSGARDSDEFFDTDVLAASVANRHRATPQGRRLSGFFSARPSPSPSPSMPPPPQWSPLVATARASIFPTPLGAAALRAAQRGEPSPPPQSVPLGYGKRSTLSAGGSQHGSPSPFAPTPFDNGLSRSPTSSLGRGGVDGSGAPARPPSLRAA